MSSSARTPKQIGNIVRHHRHERKLTQAQLADMAGTLQRQVSLLETGSDSLRIETICNVIAALDLIIKVEPNNVADSPTIQDIF
jgi:HTH-type transcriptional regulator / antitoxin HipB